MSLPTCLFTANRRTWHMTSNSNIFDLDKLCYEFCVGDMYNVIVISFREGNVKEKMLLGKQIPELICCSEERIFHSLPKCSANELKLT